MTVSGHYMASYCVHFIIMVTMSGQPTPVHGSQPYKSTLFHGSHHKQRDSSAVWLQQSQIYQDTTDDTEDATTITQPSHSIDLSLISGQPRVVFNDRSIEKIYASLKNCSIEYIEVNVPTLIEKSLMDNCVHLKSIKMRGEWGGWTSLNIAINEKWVRWVSSTEHYNERWVRCVKLNRTLQWEVSDSGEFNWRNAFYLLITSVLLAMKSSW